MRYSNFLLPFVATAAAIVIPDEATAKQLVLDVEQKVEETASSWRDRICHGANAFLSAVEDTLDNSIEGIGRQTSKFNDGVGRNLDILVGSDITDFLSPEYLEESHWPHKPHGPHGPHGHFTNLTVYQAIHASNHTTKFAKLVDDFPDIVDKLNTTSANVTIFVPTDHAFEKIPDHVKDHKPPKEFVEKLIKYHVLPGFYPAGRVVSSHTLPTTLEEEQLGGQPQRIRVSFGLFGVKLNFFSKVVFANLITSNGALHAVDSILAPPPPAKVLISLFPIKFSTLELAAAKTGFTHHHKHSNSTHPSLKGLTVFAPTNLAFKKLGPRANAFLFNSPKGLHFLRALLAYHVVVNETLYSDAYYGHQKAPLPASTSDFSQTWDEPSENEDENEEVNSENTDGHFHIDLPTLLGDKHIGVDIARWHSFIRVKLNGRIGVAIQDGLAREGVVHVVDSILIPPHPKKHRGVWRPGSEEGISVQELIERLEPYVEEEADDVGEVEGEDIMQVDEGKEEEDVQVEL
ncbi:FAS1 domain-containing protein [Rostrohypoxylon terebratum]|nr:FAS1 domain-containing protein [Rostrohypoxylon terebratum]